MVERFDPELNYTWSDRTRADMEPNKEGDYVRYQNYEALQAENGRLREALRETEWLPGRGGVEFCICCDNIKEKGHAPDCLVGQALSPAPEKAGGKAPTTEGETCQACGRCYDTVWRAPDPLWARVSGKGEAGKLCPRCFDEKARTQGIALYWECAQGRYPTDSPKCTCPKCDPLSVDQFYKDDPTPEEMQAELDSKGVRTLEGPGPEGIRCEPGEDDNLSSLFAFGSEVAKKAGLTPEDSGRMLKQVRAQEAVVEAAKTIARNCDCQQQACPDTMVGQCLMRLIGAVKRLEEVTTP